MAGYRHAIERMTRSIKATRRIVLTDPTNGTTRLYAVEGQTLTPAEADFIEKRLAETGAEDVSVAEADDETSTTEADQSDTRTADVPAPKPKPKARAKKRKSKSKTTKSKE